MQNEEKDLRDRTKHFALSIIRMFSMIPKTTEAQVLGKQMLRSGTSVGANYREAYRRRSKGGIYREGAAICFLSLKRTLTGLNCSLAERSSRQKHSRRSDKNVTN
jgi:four helix bundle protein